MDQFEYTKLAAAILLPLLLIFGFKAILETRTEHLEAKPGYSLAGAPAPEAAPAASATKAAEAKPAEAKPAEAAAPAEGKTAEAAPAAAPKAEAPKAEAPKTEAAGAGPEAVLALLPKGDAGAGKAVFNKCKACHVIEKGKPKTTGPNLFGVVNRPKGSSEGFEYSPGMKAKGGDWAFADLAAFISNPKGFVSGTKMVFNGLPDPKDAADVIAYLAQQHEPPVELPK